MTAVLIYLLEQGPREARIIEQAFRMHQPIPGSIKDAPSLYLGLELFLNGFFDLSSSRQVGSPPGDISWVTIQQYCEHLGLSEGQTEDMHHHIPRLDETWHEHHPS